MEGPPRLWDPLEASALSGNGEGKSSVSSDLGNTQCLVHGASEMGWEAGGGPRKYGTSQGDRLCSPATVGHSPAVLMPQFPRLVLNEHAGLACLLR